ARAGRHRRVPPVPGGCPSAHVLRRRHQGRRGVRRRRDQPAGHGPVRQRAGRPEAGRPDLAQLPRGGGRRRRRRGSGVRGLGGRRGAPARPERLAGGRDRPGGRGGRGRPHRRRERQRRPERHHPAGQHGPAGAALRALPGPGVARQAV
ncbi:MAG: hypothetical protein AVDCRST_MAG07-2506, partial [uncultured Frankineae bacterium]